VFMRKNNDKKNTFQCGTIGIGTKYDGGNLGNAFLSRLSSIICFFVLVTFIILNDLALIIFSLAESFEHQKISFWITNLRGVFTHLKNVPSSKRWCTTWEMVIQQVLRNHWSSSGPQLSRILTSVYFLDWR